MSLYCEICKEPCETVTEDEEHVICSFKCIKALQALQNGGESLKKQEKNTLTVEGRGEEKVIPDRVRVTLVIIQRAALISDVNKLLIERSDALINLLQKETDGKAEKIQTKELSIEPIRQKSEQQIKDESNGVYNNYKGPIVAYEGTFPISFEALIASAGPIIDLSLRNDVANQVEAVSYIVSDDIGKSAYARALRSATLDAEEKAHIVLDALGLRKSGILSIIIDNTGFARNEEREEYASFAPKAKMAVAMKSTQLIAGETTINATVNLTLSYQ